MDLILWDMSCCSFPEGFRFLFWLPYIEQAVWLFRHKEQAVKARVHFTSKGFLEGFLERRKRMHLDRMWKAVFFVVCLSFVSVASLQGCPSTPTTDGGETAVEKTTEQTAEQAAETTAEQAAEQVAETAAETAAETTAEKAAETTAEATAETTAEATAETTADGGAETTPEMTAEATPEAGGQNKLTVSLRSLNPQVPQAIFIGANVCEEGTQNCAAANADAKSELMIDVGKVVYISVEGTSPQQPIYPLRFAVNMPARDLALVAYVFLNQEVQGLAGAAGIQVDPSKGMLGIRSLDDMGQAKDGVAFTMNPASGQGPIYLNLTGYPDTTLTKTSQAGTGFFANTTPNADFSLIAAHDTLTCKALAIYPSDANGDLKLNTKAGTLTTASITCK